MLLPEQVTPAGGDKSHHDDRRNNRGAILSEAADVPPSPNGVSARRRSCCFYPDIQCPIRLRVFTPRRTLLSTVHPLIHINPPTGRSELDTGLCLLMDCFRRAPWSSLKNASWFAFDLYLSSEQPAWI